MTSARSSVPPFHAMEMAGLATARRRPARRSSTSRWASPGRRRPRPCSPRRRGRSSATGSGTPTPAACSRCARGSPGTTRTGTASSVDPAALVITAGASAGFTLAFLACFDPGDRVGVVEPGYPCYRNTLLALGVEPVAIAVGPETRWAPTPELLDARRTARRAGRRQPVEPDRHGPGPRAAGRGGRLVPRRTTSSSISDEIYHGITYGQRADERCSRCRATPSWCQQLLEVLLDDRLAARLDHRAARRDATPSSGSSRTSTSARRRSPSIAAVAAFDCAEELDGHVARYAAQPPACCSTGLAAAGLDRPRRGRRRVLRLRRRLPPRPTTRRLAVPPLAGGDRRRDRRRASTSTSRAATGSSASPTPATPTTSPRLPTLAAWTASA